MAKWRVGRVPRRTNTRERLITAAAKLFWRQGYAQTGVNEIISAARTTSGSFYHFFPAKEDLLLAVVERVGATVGNEVFTAAAEASDDPLEQVFVVVEASRRHLEANDFELGSPLGSLAAELSASHPQVRQRIAVLFDAWVERVAEMLESARDRLPAGLDHRAFARFILAVVEGATLQARVSRSLTPFDDAVVELRRHVQLQAAVTERPVEAPRQQARPAPRTAAADWRAW
jgi:TetR/AcrR family transcriptional repressor of nem operon